MSKRHQKNKENFSEVFLLLFMLPFVGLMLGAIYSWPAMVVTKERDPWLTLLLALGLGITVFGVGIFSHIPLSYLAAVWLLAVILLLLVRSAFGLTGNIEHFGMAHILTILLVLLASVFSNAQRKSALLKSKPPNIHVEHKK